ncbi:MAG TPA: GNVR domain-containing protein, partial [Fibrobacteria bacterium]|nr:GNVR domain-containing protein [Fibrobacteria bacterium]
DLLKELDENIGITITDEGTFALTVEDEDPKRAADMANFMAAKLNDIYQRLTSETQRNQRIFLGERLDLIKADLEAAEQAFTDFQKKNKMLDIGEQARATIDAGSNLDARYLAAELNLDITRKVYSPENPKVKELEMELRELKRQRESFASQRKSDLLIPYNLAPDLGLELLRLKRNFKVQETLFELVIQQYEYAKFEESKSTPTVQVLDKAEPPQKRASPKRSKIVIAVFMASLAFGALLAVCIEAYRRFRDTNPVEYAKLRRLRESVFSWKFLLP